MKIEVMLSLGILVASGQCWAMEGKAAGTDEVLARGSEEKTYPVWLEQDSWIVEIPPLQGPVLKELEFAFSPKAQKDLEEGRPNRLNQGISKIIYEFLFRRPEGISDQYEITEIYKRPDLVDEKGFVIEEGFVIQLRDSALENKTLGGDFYAIKYGNRWHPFKVLRDDKGTTLLGGHSFALEKCRELGGAPAEIEFLKSFLKLFGARLERAKADALGEKPLPEYENTMHRRINPPPGLLAKGRSEGTARVDAGAKKRKSQRVRRYFWASKHHIPYLNVACVFDPDSGEVTHQDVLQGSAAVLVTLPGWGSLPR